MHIEPGLWVAVPQTSNPSVGPTVARLASIPHGTAIVAQGTASTASAGPNIPVASIKPFTIGQPNATFDFAEQTLTNHTSFRTSGAGLTGVTQAMVNDPNSVLHTAITGQHITSHDHAARDQHRHPGPGRRHREHRLPEGRHDTGPNAVAATVTATFWLETVQGQRPPANCSTRRP